MKTLSPDRGYMGDPKRGASLGRPDTVHPGNVEPGAKWTLQRVRIDRGGYDKGGSYWGVGQPLYWVSSLDCEGAETDCFFRAPDREAAKQHIRDTYDETAKFYR